MTTSRCPQCGEEIDNDSFFCDQCGAELYVCAHCHIIGKGKGKRCGQCGKELVPASYSRSETQPAPAVDPAHIPYMPKAPVYNSAPAYSSAPVYTSHPASNPTCLVCRKGNLRFPLIENAMIGRGEGDYAQDTSRLMYMSRRHAMLKLTGNQWSITDLNSTNGTKVNGMRCSPTINISKGDIVTIANTYDFIVE